MENVTVNAEALYRVLQALNGPPHHIRELQATRGPLFDNPIDLLTDEYNAALDKEALDAEDKTEITDSKAAPTL